MQQQQQQQQHASLAHALLPDLPLLLHGSGDVLPEDVHPHTVATLAKLVEKYIASLVGAAMDAHDVFTDGEVVGGGACLGVPPFRPSSKHDESDDDGDAVHANTEEAKKRQRKKDRERASRRKKRRKIDYWDMPLPPPSNNDDGDNSSVNTEMTSDDDSDDDAPLLSGLHRLHSASSATSAISFAGMPDDGTNSTSNGQSTLQGFAPLDLHSNERTRKYYVTAPTVMDARSFIFPICHDAALYQRIKEMQGMRRSIGRDLVDQPLMELLKEEGGAIGRWGVVDMWDAVLGNSAGGGSGVGSGGIGASVGKTADGKSDKIKGSSSAVGDKKKDANSATASPDKKSTGNDTEKKDGNNNNNNNDGSNLVGAGLLDPDNFDPSWPRLNVLARGRLW